MGLLFLSSRINKTELLQGLFVRVCYEKFADAPALLRGIGKFCVKSTNKKFEFAICGS